ncbi:hypothetical protein [Hoylesella loescheii]|nr:hypothetical protein [Hoylesella loescheii]
MNSKRKLFCMLCACILQTTTALASNVVALNHGKDSLQADSTGRQQVPHYQIVSAQDELKLYWTGKGFAQAKGDKSDRQYVKAILRTFDASWLAHPLTIAMKTIRVQKNGDKEETMVIVAVKSTGKRWKINAPKFKQCMIDGYKCPIYGVPYYIDGCIYIVCFIPSWQMTGNELRPEIYRETLYEGVVKPFVGKLLPLS